ncbi:MAG: DUF362 domain-containing protein [Myxococcota bacterium]|nr:DUF362 domain-containing protein [Myxococcota bacterium]
MSPSARPKVYIASVEGYGQPELLAGLRRALDAIKPNIGPNLLVQCDWSGGKPRMTPAASTRPELAQAVLELLLAPDTERFALLSGLAELDLPTRWGLRRSPSRTADFRRLGFAALPGLFPERVGLRPADEARLYRYQLSVGNLLDSQATGGAEPDHPAQCRALERVVAAWELYHADSLVLMPKLRQDLESGGFAGALRLVAAGIGGRASRKHGPGELREHHGVDLLELGDPDLVVTDAVDLGWGGSSLCQAAHPLGAIVVADNAVAHDVVCAEMLGLDPTGIKQLNMASERGYGPLDLGDIDLHSELDFSRTRLQVQGFSGGGPSSAGNFVRWYREETGFALALEVLEGDGEDQATARRLLNWLMASWDLPESREAMKHWPALSIVVGRNEDSPRSARILLVGDAAIQDFSNHVVTLRCWLRIPPVLQPFLAGLSSLLRFRLRDGRTGWAVTLPGGVPSLRLLGLAIRVASLGKMASPLLAAEGLWGRSLLQLRTLLRRRRKNRLGIPVVHARKIRRLQGRSWRQLWAQPERLQLRETPQATFQKPVGS